ncbi:nucleotidyltransferase family protein [Sphingobium sp. BYY-5]|uniref:nucleotidyltransferase family protein n=1 Tax=Sphingobium sp. BYY-5 TaxID=2926400 RepID=UPI001FA6C328|nr:nucleotidyltransferase family protein [Sphingobium sp. BYY-5]MCI4589071.1 nucleotidyltransferase family protein [Sphingobium sp. BYY-5]
MNAPVPAEQAVRRLAAGHPVVGMILSRWAAVQLSDAWLSGSLLAQARWNEMFGFPPLHGIADADIIYFDATDLSQAAEQTAAERLQAAFADLPVRLDVKNEARVHLWYPDHFGVAIPPYRSAIDATMTFPTTASAVAITPHALSAPFGLDDLLAPLVRANATQIDQAYYEAKARRWAAHWPDLPILPWNEAVRRPAPS